MNLSSSVSNLPFVGPTYLRRLEKLGIFKIQDLLLHVPHRYLDFSVTSKIGKAQVGEILTVKGEVVSIKNQYTFSGRKIQFAQITDGTGEVSIVWFNQPYLIKTIFPGDTLSVAGKLSWFGKKKAFISPEYEKFQEGKPQVHTGRIIPVYPETAGISSKWLRARITQAFLRVENNLTDFLPESLLTKLKLPGRKEAIKSVHFPENLIMTEGGKTRLALDELLFLQLESLAKKADWRKNESSYRLSITNKILYKFIDSLPFDLTPSQERSVKEIIADLKEEYPMNRLLEGDVGSGKTVVAACASFLTFVNGYQTVVMAPTQILAQQHFDTLNRLLQSFKVRVGLITSEVKKIELGRSDVFVGTHSLIHQKIDFDKVALVVIDEQHRFGVEQRAHLVKTAGRKRFVPHVLTMTATPIPRTVAQTFYGDLDLSTLDELPSGRQIITTWTVPPQKREGAYKWIRSQILKYKSQVFVVCPLIEESQVETMQQIRAATKEFEELKERFKDLKIGLIHGKLKAGEKASVLEDFRRGKTDILVATPVIEVGIDVPNATIMLIEAAERFGLAQLHQLRGRVGRGEKKSYCLLFTESRSLTVYTRLKAMTKNMSGFELAEIDLKLRGPGEIFGTRQHGFPELKIATWSDFDLIRKSKKIALDVFENPSKYPILWKRMAETVGF